jgi:hypothetical protein
MRGLLAALLATLVVLTAVSPHVHEGPHGDHDCPACVARGAEEARSATPDVEPAGPVIPGAAAVAIEAPPPGAPLGAVPGQSPPA